jgi:hypothetical protein
MECLDWWPTLGPWVQRLRAEDENPSMYQHFEWVVGAMREIARRTGVTPLSAEVLASLLPRRIATRMGMLQAEQALRSVVVAAPGGLTVGSPTTAEAAAYG